jgi:hypothetical protein
VNDAVVVSVMDGTGQCLDQLGGLTRRKRRPAELLRQGPAGDEFKSEERLPVVLADLVNLDDVGMLQAGDRFRLGAKSGDLPCSGQ